MCGWDMEDLYSECDRCGSDAGDDGYCVICGALVFSKKNNEEKP
jgi:DNA-directed RNA polymerase subunit RPC12/RpoP